MKIRSSLRKMCEQCKIITRGRKNYVICKGNPRHKQRQGYTTLAGMNGSSVVDSSNVTGSSMPSFNGIRSLSSSSSSIPMASIGSVVFANDQVISSWLASATDSLSFSSNFSSSVLSITPTSSSSATSSTVDNNNSHESMGTGTLATLADTTTDIEDV